MARRRSSATPVSADLRGRRCLVTGANSGIGREVARGLARRGARVVLACRDRRRGEAALAALRAETSDAELELLEVDLSRRGSIRHAARELEGRLDGLDVLVNNAGTWSQRRRESSDGVELTWATNQLGYFLLTRELLGLLECSGRARIVNVASQLARDLELDDVELRRRPYDGMLAYAQSKQANRMFTWALARRLEGRPITANALHPGGVATPLFRKGGGITAWLVGLAFSVIGKRPAEGADTALWLAASPELEDVSDRFWIDRTEVRCRFRDPEVEERLWELCESMTANPSSG